MASPQFTSPKATSRWGSFLTGLESKLDTILADEDPTSSRRAKGDGSKQEDLGKAEAPAQPEIARARGDGSSRPQSANRAQDRLNERLAKAMASRNLARKSENSATASGLPSGTASPANVTESPRTSSELISSETKNERPTSLESTTIKERASEENSNAPSKALEEGNGLQNPATVNENDLARSSSESHNTRSAHPSLELGRTPSHMLNPSELNGIEVEAESKNLEDYKQTIMQMQADYETSELRRQEETHEYLERIDALQSKLQYLTKETAEIAKKEISAAKPGSLEAKLAAKDEKVALLIEEGQKLSQTELKHMNIIKKLRAKATEDDRRMADLKRSVEKQENAARESQERAKNAEAAERRANEKSKTLLKVEKELESIRNDRDAKASLVHELQRQLLDATSLAREEEEEVQAEALEAARETTAALKHELSELKMKKDANEKQHQSEMRNLREKYERDKERARLADIERQGEQSILESRLETLRARVEEASAGSSGDVQANLLRHIETLQNQYAVASENWQGIEGSLLARVAAVEKERDEIAKREAEIRRKARELSVKSRRVEEELERVTAKSEDLQHEIAQQKTLLASLQEKLARSENDVAEARKELKAEKEAWETRQAQRLEEEKATHTEESARTPDTMYQQFRLDSTNTHSYHTSKGPIDCKASPHSRRLHGLAITGVGHPSPNDRPVSRRSSTQPLQSSDIKPLTRQESFQFVPQLSVNGAVPETPSVIDHQEEFFDGLKSPATPERTINDMISGSTAGAGPSVQLVERMSAAVRRLESEKAASKDDLMRLSNQRDEARDQVVSLMKEAEGKRAADEKIKELENELVSINKRFLTTSEMLGEKIEKVEELKADVQDLKQLYRELVERTLH